MNGAEIFYFFILPLTIVGIAWVAVLLSERAARRELERAEQMITPSCTDALDSCGRLPERVRAALPWRRPVR